MITIITIILFSASWFAFGFYNEKKMKDVIADLDRTKAILNIEYKGEELKKRKLEEQADEVVKVHKMSKKMVKRSLKKIVEDGRVDEILQ